jgi:hypothetical protein
MVLLLSCVVAVALASSDPPSTCSQDSLCTAGTAVNVTNATGTNPVHGAGLCDQSNYPWPGTKVCTVCTGCLQLYPNCTCCQPDHDASDSCSLCRVQDAYTRSQCGNPQFAYRCDTSGDGCVAVPNNTQHLCKTNPAPGGLPYLCFATQQECKENCNSYNCVNNNHCVKAPQGTPAKYPSLSACNVSCSTAPLSPCGRVKPAQCTFWQQFHDATGGGPPPYPGAHNKWTDCNDRRDDPCSCGGRTCDPTQGNTCVACKGGDITGMCVLPRTLHHKRCCLFPSLYYRRRATTTPPAYCMPHQHTSTACSIPTLACMVW